MSDAAEKMFMSMLRRFISAEQIDMFQKAMPEVVQAARRINGLDAKLDRIEAKLDAILVHMELDGKWSRPIPELTIAYPLADRPPPPLLTMKG